MTKPTTPCDETGPTPGPWTVGDSGRMVLRDVPGMCDGHDGYSVAVASAHSLLSVDEAKANAAFIVKACNAHQPAMYALRDAYVLLAFAFNRLHGSARSRDGELCEDFGKVRGRIEKVFSEAGEKL